MSAVTEPSRLATNKPSFVVCEGNEAAAIGVGLSRPDVVAVYPITPQSSLVEHLSQMIADGRLRADLMNVEGEHAVMCGLQGVALAGGRTFTATCGPGLAFMFEPYVRTPGLRLPMVASLVTRDLLSPQCVWGGQQDAMVVREAGWIQMYCETVQEILDTTVMAYKIAEHHDVMLPINVCHDGNYLSFGVTRVEVPDQQEVDDFLGPPNVNWHIALDPLRPMGVDPLTGGAGGVGPRTFVRYRKGQVRGMQNALRVIREVHATWGERFGRYHAPLVEEYRLDDADYCAGHHRQHDRRRQGCGRHRARQWRSRRPHQDQDLPAVPAAGHGGRARQGEADRRGRPFGELWLELRPRLSGYLGRALPHRQIRFRPSASSAVWPAPTSRSSISRALSR